MDKETFTKVRIKTKEDLPKIEDNYFVCRSGFKKKKFY
jgi:hypothetical protein